MSKLAWPAVLFLTLSPILATVLLVLDVANYATIPTGLWVFFLFYFVAGSMGISGGYHRLYSHRAFDAHWVVRLIYLLFGSANLENSALKWCSDHRRHHKEIDTPKDPYNINQGFFYAHMGWIFYKDTPEALDFKDTDLTRDPLIQWQYRNFMPIAIFMGFAVPTLVGAAFGNAWAGFVFGGLLRIVISHHSTFLVNSACHYFGYQTYSDQNTSRDSWFLALLTYGEGYHNFHHHFQFDYRNGVRWFHWDPTKWTVRALSWIGLTGNLKMAPKEEILKARLKMEAKRLEKEGLPAIHVEEKKSQIVQSLEKVAKYYREYQKLKSESASKPEFAQVARERLALLREDIKNAKSEFKTEWRHWKKMIRPYRLKWLVLQLAPTR